MTNKLIALLFLFISYGVNAQDDYFTESFEKDLKKCSFEPDAPAVVIFDKGITKIYEHYDNFKIFFTRHKRIKIFKESAFDYGKFEIPLYQNSTDLEIVTNIKATTHNYEGENVIVSELKDDQIFKEPINKYWYKKKFAMPNVKEGSVIDIEYTIESPFLWSIPDWEFQDEIPTIYSEYKTCMIPFYTYKYLAQGILSFDVFTSKDLTDDRSFMGMVFQDREYTFGMKNVASFKNEGFITSKEDYIKKIDFQLAEVSFPNGYSKKYMTSWPDLANDFIDSENFGKYLKKCKKYGEKEFSHLSNKTDDEKIEAIIEYVKKNYKYNGTDNKWASTKFNDFQKKKTGNSANINLMALGILNGIGIKAQPVIISTRNNGKITNKFPFEKLFNYVIIVTEINGKALLLDATDGYCDNKGIPAKCCNGKGFIIEKDSEKWVKIANVTPSDYFAVLKYNIDVNSNTLKGEASIKTTGHISSYEHKKFDKNPNSIIEAINKKGINVESDLNIFDEDKKNCFNYKFDFTGNIEQIEDQVIISPLFKFPINKNPFKQESRDYAIDFIYPKTSSYYAEFNIPEGYSVEKLPDNNSFKKADLTFNYSVSEINGKLMISAKYFIHKPEYPAANYSELKDFFKTLTKSLNQSIVLTKQKSIAQID